MYESHVYCFMVTWTITSDDVRDLLFVTAYHMIKSHARKRKVRSEECEGVVTTAFQHVSLAGISGIRFRAELETETGKLVVTYLVRNRDLDALEEAEEGAWVSDDDSPEDVLGRFRENPIRKAAQSHQWN